MVQCPPRMTSGRRQCARSAAVTDVFLMPGLTPTSSHRLLWQVSRHPMIVSTRRGVVGAHAGAPPAANPVATRDRRAAAAGATTTQGVQIELANLWQTASSSSRGGDRPGVTPRPELLVWCGAPTGIEPATPSLP